MVGCKLLEDRMVIPHRHLPQVVVGDRLFCKAKILLL